jgi:hypothetical protein
MDPEVHVASTTDLDALVRLAAAFRDHLGQARPLYVDFHVSIARLLKYAGTEFFFACDAQGTALECVQCRYRYSSWTSALEAELEDVFVVSEAWR